MEHPGVKWAHGRARRAKEAVDFLNQILAAHNDTANTPALTIQVLGGGVNNHIGAKLQRTLQYRRAETVVDYQQGITGVSQFGHGGDVCHLTQGVRGCFQKQHPRLPVDGLFPFVNICKRHKAGGHTEPGEVFLEQHIGGTKHTAGTDHVVAAFQQRHAGGHDRRHPGRSSNSAFASLHGRDAVFEGSHGGVGEPGVDIARLVAGEPCRRLCCAVINETGGGKDGIAVFQLTGTALPCPHSQSVDRHPVEVRLWYQVMFFAPMRHGDPGPQSSSLWRSIIPLSVGTPTRCASRASSRRIASSRVR